MIRVVENVAAEALSLTKEERAFLADRLLSSLGGEVLNEVDLAWVTEAERRYADYQSGKRKPIPASRVFDEVDRITR